MGGCETIFSGTPDYDIAKQIASFEQDLVKQPAGILLHPMQADPFIEPINRAIEAGTEIVTFAADSPKSNRTSYITSDNVGGSEVRRGKRSWRRSATARSTRCWKTLARATMISA